MGGGIGVAEGAEPIVRGNICKENLRAGIGCSNASPIIIDNHCFANIRAGIGCREGSRGLVRRNKCYRNRRAGIGIRMVATSPIVEDNECYENEMSGIGCRSDASPILRSNTCRDNKMAGIGCDGASPLIIGNQCSNNQQAGIGAQGQATVAIYDNRCVDNELVAIGVTDGSTAIIQKNQLGRKGGAPPIIAVKGDSAATIRDNKIVGGGVAAVLLQGKATVTDNLFVGAGENQGNAIWVREGSRAIISSNQFQGYRTAVNAKNAEVVVNENEIGGFQGTAIIVKDSPLPAHVYGNIAVSVDPKARVIEVQGLPGIVEANALNKK
jgi:parallel beta-helix repeat protein